MALALAGCAVQPDVVTDDGVDPVEPHTPREAVPRTLLSPTEQAIRVSVALRGRHPSPQDLQAVREDPAALDALVDTWLQAPGFGATIKELYAEVLRVRTADLRYPQIGPLANATAQETMAAVSEEPLRLIEHVVTQGRPFTEIVTADYTVLDSVAAKMWSGHAYQPGGEDVQRVAWTDGRPAAGILSTNGLWARHVSAGSNYHRGRANVIADALLCEDFLARDVPIDGGIDLSDDVEVANALQRQPECVSCHQALDPLAAHLWSFFPEYTPAAVAVSNLTGCTTPFLDLCYPFDPYRPEYGLARLLLQLRPPGFYGTPTEDLGDVGQAIAQDPRFARCTVERFWSWFHQRPVEEAPFEVVSALQLDFVESGYDARSLARSLVMHPDYLSRDIEDPVLATRLPGPLLVRPHQHAGILEGLTGFRYVAHVDNLVCDLSGRFCHGDADLSADDVYGFRSMTGGIDGSRVTRPTHTMTPVKALYAATMAEEAAGWVVKQAFDEGGHRLFAGFDTSVTDEAAVRARLASLHADLLAEDVTPDGPEVDATFSLWSTVFARSGRARVAWQATLAALLQSPHTLFY